MTSVLPDKFVPELESLVGQGAIVLQILSERSMTAAQLLAACRTSLPHVTYDGLVETLNALFALGLVELDPDPLLRLTA